MKTLGFDVSALDPAFKAHALRGIGRYVNELKQFFIRHEQELPFKVLFFDHAQVLERQSRLVRGLDNMVRSSPLGKATLRQQLLYPFALSQLGADSGGPRCDAVHFPAHMDAPAWGMKGYAITVLDLIPLVCADLYKANKSGPRYHFARWLEQQGIMNSSLVLAISENTARDVAALMKVPQERIVVTPLGVSAEFYSSVSGVDGIREKFGIGHGPIVLYVGGIDPRKNYPVLVRAFTQLVARRQQKGLSRPVLVFAGRIQDDREYPRLMALIRESKIESDVRMPGYVADADLLKLFKVSAVFAFPSLYEGFGLQPLEAMAAGLPVVSSNTSCLPEVLGDAALYAHPDDAAGMAAALAEVIENAELGQDLRERGKKQAALFSWERTGEKTVAGYQKLLKI